MIPKWFRKEMLPFYDAQPGVDWGVAGLHEEVLGQADVSAPVRTCAYVCVRWFGEGRCGW